MATTQFKGEESMKKGQLFTTFAAALLVVSSGLGMVSSVSAASKKADVTTSASKAKYTPAKELKQKYDVIIVGAGGAGMSAALAAKQKGLNPVILEKMPTAGGNTLKASSGMNASETKVEKKNGVKDTNKQFYEETLKGGHYKNDKALLHYMVNNSASAIDWLDSMGMKLDKLTISGGMSVKRTHRPHDGSAVGTYLASGLLRNVKQQKIPLFVNADVTKINEKDNKVSGVKVVMNQEKTKTVKAKAVIVTTGGYGASKKMIKKYRPDLANYVSTNQKGSTGDGLKMITKLGGATTNLDQIQIHPTVYQKPPYLIGEATRGEGGILVNKAGDRFTNDMGTRDKVSAAINKQDGKMAYVVFDAGVLKRSAVINQYIKKGFTKQGNTVAELAKQINVPATELEKTMTTWNKSVTDHKDKFGRTTGMDHQLNQGPYYAIPIAPGIHYTMGGVKTNTKTQVLKKSGKTIPGLYAAGEVVGGLHGYNRIGGNSVCAIIVFGRQAGNQAAAYLK
ncbi:fumarate reductase flavoprotein subunit [Loigolactobacillus bifermentans DSM 20003]|uniref:Fumarate reductase flavoprotein subunit n=2 Tax=Loigolactobacillus bifermentans TaxID=1607 RepID=A0A0R1H2I6_9LACO|nr:fumarate reductase flavoprotein subunit [Loigolactobacillus bifermentans DSM 20003]